MSIQKSAIWETCPAVKTSFSAFYCKIILRLFFEFRNFLFSLRKVSNFFYCLLKTCFSFFWTFHWIISFCSLFSLINCVLHQSLECQVCLCWRIFLRKTKFLGSEVTIDMYQIRALEISLHFMAMISWRLRFRENFKKYQMFQQIQNHKCELTLHVSTVVDDNFDKTVKKGWKWSKLGLA